MAPLSRPPAYTTTSKRGGLAPPPSKETLTAICAAFTEESRALRIDAANQSAGWGDLDQLVTSGGCFAAQPGPHIVALDADTPGAVDQLEVIASQLERGGVRVVRLLSGGAGRRQHLFAHIDDQALRTRVHHEAYAAGIDVRSHQLIRPPGVPHRSGAQPELLSPTTWGEVAAALSPAQVVRQSTRLPAQLWTLVRHGDTTGRWVRPDGTVDDSRVLLAIVNSARAAGVDKQRLLRLLSDHRNAGGRSLHKRRGPQARALFERTWRTASRERHQRIGGREDALAELERVATVIAQHAFSGRSGNSDATVLEAAVRLGRRFGGPVAPMSVRELALESGRSVPTVRAALGRLTQAGWLCRVATHEGDRAAVWRIQVPRGTCTGSLPDGGCGSVQEVRDSPGDDMWASGVLGPTMWRIVTLLDAAPESVSVSEIAERTGLHPGTVRRWLTRGWHLGVFERDVLDGRVYVTLCEGWRSSAQALCDARGGRGRRARRCARFVEERSLWRLLLPQQRARRLALRRCSQNRGGTRDSLESGLPRPSERGTPGAAGARQPRTGVPSHARVLVG